MGVFDNAKIVKINNNEVHCIKTNDGRTIYQKPIIATVTGNTIKIGEDFEDWEWLQAKGNVIVNWGDGTTSTINNPSASLTHTYTDGKQNHDIIIFFAEITRLDDCFYHCTGLKEIVIPNGLTSLGNDCFHGCTGLTSITIPNSVTYIEAGCFCNCSGLTSVTIPASVVTDSWGSVFDGCTSLNAYQLYWTNNNIPMYYNNDHMLLNANTKFYVPKGQKANYVNKGYPSAKVVERSS